MVHNSQNYWVFVLCPSSGVLETRKHGVSVQSNVVIEVSSV
jgi:hypothetical protein